MKNKSINNKAYLHSICFSIGVYLLLLIYMTLSSGPLNQVILVLIPILIIEYSKAIYEALADKEDIEEYEIEKKNIGILAPMMASIIVLLYIIRSLLNLEDPSTGAILFFTAIIILLSLIFYSKKVINKINSKKTEEIVGETLTKEDVLDDENMAEEVYAKQRDEEYQKKELESDFNGNYIKGDNTPLNGDNKNDIDKSQLTFLIGLVLLTLSIVMKLSSKDRS